MPERKRGTSVEQPFPGKQEEDNKEEQEQVAEPYNHLATFAATVKDDSRGDDSPAIAEKISRFIKTYVSLNIPFFRNW